MCLGEKRAAQCVECNIKTFEKFVWLGCVSGNRSPPSDWTELSPNCPSTVMDMVRMNRCSTCVIALREMQLNIPDFASNPRPVQPCHPNDTTGPLPPLYTYDWSETLNLYETGRANMANSTSMPQSAETDNTGKSTDKPSKISRIGAPVKRMISRRGRTAPVRPSNSINTSSVCPTSSGRHHGALNSAGRSGPAPPPQLINTPDGPKAHPLRSNPVDPEIFRPTY